MTRSPRSHRDDRGVVALELVLAMPFIVALLVCSITVAGLFQTKSRVVGAARDGARSLALQAGVATPIADRNSGDGITVVLVPPACPALTSTAYQSSTPPQVIAKASKLYTVSVPFVGTWSNVNVTETATMPCG
jgi:Flp pilus assembly protein TadG